MKFGMKFKNVLQKVMPDCRLVLQAPRRSTTSAAEPPALQPVKNVIILGWGGSKQRSIAKVADFYAERGVRSMSFIMPLGIPNFGRTALLQDIVAELENLSHTGVKDVSIHLFSNNGTWSYATLMELISSRNASLASPLPRVDRVVYDSGPHLFYEDLGIHDEVKMYSLVATSIVLGRAQYEHPVISPLLKGILYVINSIHRVIRLVQDVVPAINLVPRYVEMNLYLRNKSPAIPHLFLYSKDDGLVDPTYVQAYAADLTERFVQEKGPEGAKLVEVMAFTGVEHTAPFFNSNTRAAYRQRVAQFMGIDE
jgi:hypothetical protein